VVVVHRAQSTVNAAASARSLVSRRCGIALAMVSGAERRGVGATVWRCSQLREVIMSGRRSEVRWNLTTAWGGVLRVLRQVMVVRRAERGEFVAISTEPAVVGEALTLDLTADETEMSLPVRVQETRPVVVDGALRHRLVLQPLESGDAETMHDGTA
jgi:hypothetical protein